MATTTKKNTPKKTPENVENSSSENDPMLEELFYDSLNIFL